MHSWTFTPATSILYTTQYAVLVFVRSQSTYVAVTNTPWDLTGGREQPPAVEVDTVLLVSSLQAKDHHHTYANGKW
jgi:hypothetical protein